MSKDSHQRTCDVQASDEVLLARFEDGIGMLTGLVEEAFVTNQAYLLSPVLRELIRDKGREVRRLHAALHGHLVVDNPGEPLRTE